MVFEVLKILSLYGSLTLSTVNPSMLVIVQRLQSKSTGDGAPGLQLSLSEAHHTQNYHIYYDVSKNILLYFYKSYSINTLFILLRYFILFVRKRATLL